LLSRHRQGWWSIKETLALLNDPEDRERLAEAEASIVAGDLTTAGDMRELVRDRIRREGTE
jgi:antitoxin YefM